MIDYDVVLDIVRNQNKMLFKALRDKEIEVEALNKKIAELEKCNIQSIKKNNRLSAKLARMKRALHKACKLLDEIFGACPLGQFDMKLERCEHCIDESIECWKEWAKL